MKGNHATWAEAWGASSIAAALGSDTRLTAHQQARMRVLVSLAATNSYSSPDADNELVYLIQQVMAIDNAG